MIGVRDVTEKLRIGWNRVVWSNVDKRDKDGVPTFIASDGSYYGNCYLPIGCPVKEVNVS